MLQLQKIQAVGYDLDGTLYQSTPEIDNRVRTKVAEYLLQINPRLNTIDEARAHFEQRYTHVYSGTKILAEAGYQKPERIMDACLAEADIVDLIPPNPLLAHIMERISKRYRTFLITSSPQKNAEEKIRRIGINLTHFHVKVYSDTPGAGNKPDGSAFEYALTQLRPLQAEHGVYIGDRYKSDIVPAQGKGMQTIAVWSQIPEATLSIKDIKDLEGILL